MTDLSLGFHGLFIKSEQSQFVKPATLRGWFGGEWKGAFKRDENATRIDAYRPEPRLWELDLVVLAVALCLFVSALTGYPDLMGNEGRIGAYVLDAVQNGHWAIQTDASGEVASKPPLFTWIAALATLAFGEINRAAVYLPSALATAGVALVILHAGRWRFGWVAGFLGALAYLLCPVGDRQMQSARYDGLLAFPVTLGAMAAYYAWSGRIAWVWFWLAVAAGTLVKGPIGVVFSAAGLLAQFWERRSGGQSALRGSHLPGLLCFLLIVGGWFILAYREMGPAVVEKFLGRELVAHAVGTGRKETMFLGFYVPIRSFCTGFAPWSIPAAIGLWRVWKHPDPDPEQRRFERFVFCWFFAGLLLLMLAAHQRSRLIVPLLPAAALLAGRELARLLRLWSTRQLFRAVVVAAVSGLAASLLYHHQLMGYTEDVRKTLAVREVARKIRSELGAGLPIIHVDTPYALQFYLNTFQLLVPAERAAELLQSEAQVYVAVSDLDKLKPYLRPGAPPLHEIVSWPGPGRPAVRIFSNRAPTVEREERVAPAR